MQQTMRPAAPPTHKVPNAQDKPLALLTNNAVQTSEPFVTPDRMDEVNKEQTKALRQAKNAVRLWLPIRQTMVWVHSRRRCKMKKQQRHKTKKSQQLTLPQKPLNNNGNSKRRKKESKQLRRCQLALGRKDVKGVFMVTC
jgi:hypothetical protein